MSDRSWIVVSLLGVLILLVPVYDIWDDATNLSWSLTSTLVENSVLLLLALGLVYGGFWLRRREWEPKYKRIVAQWSVGISAAIATLYGFVIALQLWAMGTLKPWVLALDGVLFGSVAAFAVGIYNASQERVRGDLERSRERYRTLTDDVMDSSDVATFIIDEEFRIVWANAAVAEYFGVDRDALVGRDKRDVAVELADRFEQSNRVREQILATYDDNTYTEEFECHVVGGDDHEERWLQHWSQPIKIGLYEGGRMEHYTDITDLKERERMLERREAKLREMYEVIADSSQTFEEQVDAILGIGRELFDAEYGSFARIDREDGTYEPQVVQAERADVAAGDTIPLAETHCEQMIQQEETLQFETRPFDADEKSHGTDIGFEMYVGTPVYENDAIYGSLCFLDRDEAAPFDEWQLTMVRLMGNWIGYEINREHLLEARERRLREERSKIEEFVDAVDNYAIFTLDADGRVTSWNEGAELITGYTREEIIGESVETFYSAEKREADLPATLLDEAKRTGQALHTGERVRKDGTTFWADVTIGARYDDEGEHVGYTKVVKDLTEQRQRKRNLEHERERLEFMNRIIRHNILNGLNLVDARAGLLESSVPEESEAREHLTTIQNRVDDLASLVTTMRTFMNAVVRGADHQVTPVRIREELDEKLELTRNAHPDVTFDVHDLPTESASVFADELISEVFENVLSNAIVHNDGADRHVEVWTTETTREVRVDAETGEPLENRPDDGRDGESRIEERRAIVVHVADNGPGIPDGDKEAVLEKGVSGLSEPGNGFGLYLVKEMMHTYGGAVDIRDNDRIAGDGGTVVDLAFIRAE